MRFLGLEIKRVLTTRLTWILLCVAILCSIFMAYIPVTFEAVTYTGDNGQEVQLKGVEAVKYLQETRAHMEGEVTPEKAKTALAAFQECLTKYGVTDTYELPDEADTEGLLPYWDYLHGIREVFADEETGIAPELTEINLKDTEQYYEKATRRTEALLKMEQADSAPAQKKAMEMYEKVEKPFQYYSGISSNSMDYQVLLIYIIAILCVVIAAPVFTSDYQTGADDILRCTKHGHGKMAVCKILSALLICGGAFLLCSIVWIVITNALFGWESTKTSIQFIFSISSLPDLTVGETQWVNLAASFFMFFAILSFTLYVSTKMRSTVSSLAVALLFCILPMLAGDIFPGKLGLWIQSILPGGGIGMGNSFLYALIDFNFLNMGNLSVWTPYALVFFAVIQIPLFLGMTVYSHCKMRQ
ncbi:MAG: ABC transporter permease subunit [Blautia sp.]|uniref:ABC transporter permease subunit n=1 Tax=Blautia sp. TaxID=1955243 RepID=UPI002E76EE28|nr:ABC transporter permease subunit [Blautia sp.]MEE1442182.1 ABC transporter permease subunit [Blautia sp.]